MKIGLGCNTVEFCLSVLEDDYFGADLCIEDSSILPFKDDRGHTETLLPSKQRYASAMLLLKLTCFAPYNLCGSLAEMEEQPNVLVRLLQSVDARQPQCESNARERDEAQGQCGEK